MRPRKEITFSKSFRRERLFINHIYCGFMDWNHWFLLFVVIINCPKLPFTCSLPTDTSSTTASNSVVPGSSIHLFPRYGTTKIQEQSLVTPEKRFRLHEEFHIDLCEDVHQLVQAYFRRFNIEGLDKPWRAFAGGWKTASLEKFFGIDPIFFKGDFRYMLVRVLMVRKAGKLVPLPNVTVVAEIEEYLEDFRSDDYLSVFNFFNEVGTHYIRSVLTGNSVYQVFVYDQHGYDAVKRRLNETGWVRSTYMAQLPYLLPLWVKHIGKVMVLNAHPQAVQHIREALRIRGTLYKISHPSTTVMCAAVTTNNTDNLGSGPSSVSRSGRVRKKSSLLADYESTDGFDKPRKKYEKEKTPKSKEKNSVTPKVTLRLGPTATADTPKNIKKGPKGKRLKLSPVDLQQTRPDSFMMDDDEGELEIDLPAEYENNIPILGAEEIIDEELLDEEDGATEVAENTSVNRLKSQAESTYFMEKSMEKNRKALSTTPGQPGKVKQARKDKGSSRVTAYMLWSKEQRATYEKKNTGMDLPQMSKKLSDLWATVPQNQKMMWKNKAAKIMKKNSNLSENMKNSGPKGKSLQKLSPHQTQHHPSQKHPQHPSQHPLAIKENPVKSPKKSTHVGTGVTTNKKLSPGGKAGKTNKSPNNRQQPGKSKVTNNLNQPQASTSKKVSPPRGKGKPNAKKNSSLKNNFSLVGSSEFSQQTNVQINGDTRKVQKNSNNSVSVASMSQSSKYAGSSHSKAGAHHFSPKKEDDPAIFSPKKEDDPAMYKVTGTAPIDVAAHFSLLGESLSIIGERLKEHEGQTVSGSLSVLLDSLLCACGPLLCLTQQVPELNSIPPEKLAHILDNIAYIMPGL
ncbi:unnamed protein product [Allacma fusca]|uniref:HMG box domain-containing protein n=1 Tax=Allacma fusca TaxID=39272 RepID=A0A8J2PMC6_9HEXA|nr:unnamed protein product [Allacma fusca]